MSWMSRHDPEGDKLSPAPAINLGLEVCTTNPEDPLLSNYYRIS